MVTLMGDDTTPKKTLVLTDEYRFTSPTQITLNSLWGPGNGYNLIEIRRVTSATDRLVNFSDGSILRAYDLNTSQIQAIHIAEEGRDVSSRSLLNNTLTWDALNLRIRNLANPLTALDAANKGYVDLVSATNGSYLEQQLNRTLRGQPGENITWMPNATARASKVLGFDSQGNPTVMAPATGSGTELALDLADAGKGSKLVAWERAPLTEALRNVNQLLSSQMCNIWEFSKYVTTKPVVNDPNTWDWTPAFHAVQVMFSAVYVPKGQFGIAQVRQKVEDFQILGESPSTTILYVSSGVGIYDYEGADNAPGGNHAGLTIRNLQIKGPYVNPDDFSSPANSWALASGLTKDLADTSLVGIRLKRSSRTCFDNVKFTGLHVGWDQYGGVAGLVERCVFDNMKIGHRSQNGASWGDASYKSTTMTVRNNFYSRLWVGQYNNEWVDDCRSYANIFEPCNTAQYILNGGSIRGVCILNDYYERCYEGIVFNGGGLIRWVVKDPYFAGTPGNFWGYGKSINIQVGASANFRLFLEGSAMGGGGLLNSSNGQVIADNLEVAGGEVFPTLFLKNRRNKHVAYDPLFSRGSRMFDHGAGVLDPTFEDDNGQQVMVITGTGTGLAFNGMRFRRASPRSEPLRMKFKYKYNGTNTNFQAIGVRVGGSLVGPTINPTSTWVTYDGTWSELVSGFTLGYFYGGFNGELRIKGFWASEGYGLAESYAPTPEDFKDVAVPTTGTSFASDKWRPWSPAVGATKGGTCTVTGSPGTYVSEGNL